MSYVLGFGRVFAQQANHDVNRAAGVRIPGLFVMCIILEKMRLF